MSQMLQACGDMEEALQVAGNLLHRIFPEDAGALYLFRASRNVLEKTAEWNSGTQFISSFQPNDCWGIRRGRTHDAGVGEDQIVCVHSAPKADQRPICLPLMANGEALGVLSLLLSKGLENHNSSCERLPEEGLEFLVGLAEHLALAIANIQLRETLQRQAMRDSLTGLFNRRYINEAIEVELRQAERASTPLSVIMIDIDHFKRFNDTYGHDAGDIVLAEVGHFFSKNVRTGDLACRYGGEEFLIILPAADEAQANMRAETLRTGVEALILSQGETSLEGVTISCGVATYPAHQVEAAELISIADSALYQAKNAGRNRVVVASSNTVSDAV